MNSNPQDPMRGRMEGLGRKIDERINDTRPRMEEELRRVIAYLNDEVVPQVRRNSTDALKIAAEKLTKLAEALERGKGQQPPAAGKH
jgi:hypothetical protein